MYQKVVGEMGTDDDDGWGKEERKKNDNLIYPVSNSLMSLAMKFFLVHAFKVGFNFTG